MSMADRAEQQIQRREEVITSSRQEVHVLLRQNNNSNIYSWESEQQSGYSGAAFGSSFWEQLL